MEARELRIGNLVYPLSGGAIRIPIDITHRILEIGLFKVKFLREDLIPAQQETWIERHLKDIAPIPLTEEWLIKFGFGKSISFDSVTQYVNNQKDLNKDSWTVEVGKDGVYFSYCTPGGWLKVDFVHQLQNFYFGLTGEELTIS